MPCVFSKRKCYLSLGLLVVVYLLLFFYGDLYISKFALHTLGLKNSNVIKGFNALCSHQVFEVLAFSIVILYLVLPKGDYSKKIIFVALSLVIAMLFKDNLKWIFGRARPEAYFKDHVYGMQWFDKADIYSSTPSGHATRSMVLCTALALLCKAKWLQVLLILFAVAQAMCRVVLLRHYLSDVLFGLWLGLFIALYIYSVMFDERKERR